MYLKSVRGIEGEVTIPGIGASIGTTAKWSLERREDRTSGVGVYVFGAAFSYLNDYLFRESSLTKEIKIRVGKEGKWYRIEQVPGSGMSIDDMYVRFEEVTVWPLQES